MKKSDKNFFFAIFLLIVSIILFINSFIYGIFTILAAFSHLIDSDQIKKYVSSKKIENEEDTNKIDDKNIDDKKNEDKILTKNYKRSGFSILLKLLAVLGILGYTAYLGYTDYIG